jgi:raffinose/stachyose/melibiose transport system substrate-binding protein
VVKAQPGINRRELLQRGAVLGVGATSLGGLLAGCGDDSPSKSVSTGSKPVVGKNLTLWSQATPDTPYGKVIAATGARWSAAGTGRSFRPVVVDAANYYPKFKTTAAAGGAPDIMQMSLSGEYTDLINAGLLLPLDDLISELPHYFPVAVDRLKHTDGRTYALPLDVNNLSIAYNTEIFDKLGLSRPTTQDELIALVKSLRDAGHDPTSMGVKDQWPAGDVFFAQLAYTDPDGKALDAATRGDIGWDDPKFLQAAQMAEKLAKGGILAKGAESLDAVTAYTVFGGKKVAMTYPGIGDMSAYVGKKLKYDFFPFPPADSSVAPRATGGTGFEWSIPAKGKNPEGAKQLIKLFADKTTINTLVQNSLVPPFKTDVSSNPNPAYQAEVKLQPTAAPRGIFQPKVSTALFAKMASLMSGDSSAQDVITALTKAAKS